MLKPLETKRGIDLAPMVDIIFLLVAYFLINSSLVKTQAIALTLPKSGTAIHAEADGLNIYIRESGEIRIGKTIVAPEKVTSVLKKAMTASRKPKVHIKGDGNVSYQRIITLIDSVHRAGITDFNLTTTRK